MILFNSTLEIISVVDFDMQIEAKFASNRKYLLGSTNYVKRYFFAS